MRRARLGAAKEGSLKPKFRHKIFTQPERPDPDQAPWANIWVRADTSEGIAWLALESFTDYGNLTKSEPCEVQQPEAAAAEQDFTFTKRKFTKRATEPEQHAKIENVLQSAIDETLADGLSDRIEALAKEPGIGCH